MANDNISIDSNRATGLGWEVVRHGYTTEGDYVLHFLGGMDDTEPVWFQVIYRPSKSTRAPLFRRAVVAWPGADVQRNVTSQARLWHLVETLAPQGGAS